jgi:hydrophobic/amphiphilic exporter-1 (mainly G- bacteria), HAE1 family
MIALAIRRPVTVAMFTLAALVFGMILLNRLGFNLLPELAYPTLTVRTEFPGSAPNEVENIISIPLEGSLATVKGLRQVRSISKAGTSDIYLEFYWGTNMDLASLDVREKMDQVNLPLEVEPPTLLRFNPNNEPIIRLSLNAVETISRPGSLADQGRDPEQVLAALRREAELRVTRFLETVNGVAAARASGGLEDEIQVLVNQSAISQLGVTIDDISQRLRNQNVNLSGGQIRSGYQQLLVRTFNEYTSVEEIADTVIYSRDQRIVRLRDVAEVKMGHKDPTAITRHNGEQAVEIAIYKEGDANIVQVAGAVKERLPELQALLPDTMRLTVLNDASVFIDQAINDLLVSGAIGGLLAMIVIYLFLGDIRPTLIISVTIPLSVIISFNFMYMSAIDLNIMSLGGLALAIGMLVDNAIVVLENIARKREQGQGIEQAAENGTREVAGAITASTLTTIAVFLPLVFVEGIAGQLFRDQALTITYSLLVSLFIAITLIPMLASRRVTVRPDDSVPLQTINPLPARTRAGLTGRTGVGGFLLAVPLLVLQLFTVVLPWLAASLIKILLFLVSHAGRLIFTPLRLAFERAFTWIAAVYDRGLHSALAHPLLTVLIAFGTLALTLQLVYRLPQTVLPEMAQGQIIVKVEYAPGTAIELTDQRMMDLSQQLLALDGVMEVFATAGVGNKLTANPEEEGENQAEFTLLLADGLNRDDEDVLLEQLRVLLETQRSIVAATAERPQLFTFATPLSVQIFGYDFDALRNVANAVMRRLEASDTFLDISSNTRAGYPEAQVRFDQRQLAQLGIGMQQASNAVVNAIKGTAATRYRLRDQQIDVLVRLSDDSRSSVEDLENLIINPFSQRPVPLGAVAEISNTIGPSEIMRIDQQRVVTVEAQIRGSDLAGATAEAEAALSDLLLPYGVSIYFAGQSEEMARSFSSLLFALGLAVFLVYLVMASQFESLLHPFIILLSVPLALIGAILALYLTSTQLSVIVFLGLIMLAGIVVNNAIVLVDRINQLRVDGVEKLEAIYEAARSRLRPILMTTMTTTLGMLPLAMGMGDGSEIRTPLAITVIGGLLISTFLTLLVVPVMYQLLDRKAFRQPDDETGSVAAVGVR